MKKIVIMLAFVVTLGGCQSVLGLGGLNETFYDEQTTTTVYETDETTGERVVASKTVGTQQVRGTTMAPPFGKVDGDVGTTIIVDGETGGYTFDSAGRAAIESDLTEAFKAFFNAVQSVGLAQVNEADSEAEALMREMRQMLADFLDALMANEDGVSDGE